MGFRSPSIYSQAGYRAAIRASIGLRTMPAIFSKNCRSEEHTSELQSLMRISYAVFCLTKKKTATAQQTIKYINIQTLTEMTKMHTIRQKARQQTTHKTTHRTL